MKQEVSNFYKEKGFNVVYININKEPRRVATLRKPDGTMISMSYAKYLYTSYYNCEVGVSELLIKDIVASIEKIWENSCSVNNEELIKEYHVKRTFVEYDSNLEIKSVKISWSYWDSITIELSSMGLIAAYRPEHGLNTNLLDLTWVLVEPFFFN